MTNPHLSAVPLAPPVGFRERGMAALETHQGADLISFLTLLHDQDIAHAAETATKAHAAMMQMASQASVDQQMLSSIMDVLRPVLRHSGENAAKASHFESIAEAAHALLREADAAGENVDAEQLRQVISAPTPVPPFRSLVLGFVPSSHYRLGHFRHVHTNVEWHLPFSGYSMCEESPERPMTVHVSFLHKGVVRPRPQLFSEFGMVMQHIE